MDDKEFQIKRSDNFTIVNNFILRDKNLSLKSIGLLCKMISLPPNWDYSFNGLVSICKESKSAIRTTINELKESGYIEILKKRDDKGLFVYKYIVYDMPKTLYLNKNNPGTDFPSMDNPTSENHHQLNSHSLIDKIDKTSKDEEISNFTKELIKLNYISKDEYNLTYYDNLFKEYKDNGYSNHELFMSIHYITKRIKENKFLDEDGNMIRNKFGYFKSALESNFKKLQGYSDYEDEYDWLADNEDLINNYNLSKLSNKNRDRER